MEGLAGQAVERHRDRIADLELRQGDFMHGGPHEDGVQPTDGEQGRLLGEAHARHQGRVDPKHVAGERRPDGVPTRQLARVEVVAVAHAGHFHVVVVAGLGQFPSGGQGSALLGQTFDTARGLTHVAGGSGLQGHTLLHLRLHERQHGQLVIGQGQGAFDACHLGPGQGFLFLDDPVQGHGVGDQGLVFGHVLPDLEIDGEHAQARHIRPQFGGGFLRVRLGGLDTDGQSEILLFFRLGGIDLEGPVDVVLEAAVGLARENQGFGQDRPGRQDQGQDDQDQGGKKRPFHALLGRHRLRDPGRSQGLARTLVAVRAQTTPSSPGPQRGPARRPKEPAASGS